MAHKKRISLLALLLTATMLFSAILAACGSTDTKSDADKQTESKKTESIDPGETESSAEPGETESGRESETESAQPDGLDGKDLVTEAYHEAIKDENGDNSLIFSIPRFNIPGEDIERINKELYDNLFGNIEIVHEYYLHNEKVTNSNSYHNEWAKVYGVKAGVYYEWYQNGDIVSIVVTNATAFMAVGGPGYSAYNVSISNQREATRDEVIAQAGLSEEEFYDSARKSLGSAFKAVHKESEYSSYDDEGKKQYNEYLASTLSDENINEMQIYFNGSGELCGVGEFDFWPELYYDIINLENFTLDPNYDKPLDVAS